MRLSCGMVQWSVFVLFMVFDVFAGCWLLAAILDSFVGD